MHHEGSADVAVDAPRAEVSRRTLLRGAAAGGLLIGIGGVLSACGGGGSGSATPQAVTGGGTYDGPKVDVDFWNGWTGGAAPTIVPRLVKQFNDEHPNIAVRNNTIEWADYYAKIPVAVRAGKGPDLGIAHGDYVTTFAAQQLTRPTTEIIKSLGYTSADFPAGMFDSLTFKDQQWGVPWAVTPLGLLVNTAVLERAGIDPAALPTGREDYLAALEQLRGKGVQGEWVDPFVFTGVFEWQTLLWQFGGTMFDESVSKAVFNSDAGVEALTWMTDLIKRGYSPRNVGANANYFALRDGKTAFNWQGVWQTSDLASKPQVKWATGEVPQIGPQKAVWSSSAHWVFYNQKGRDENRTRAAATFAQWFIEHSLEWAAVGELPAKNSVREKPELLQKHPYLAPYLEELKYARYETSAPGISAAGPSFQAAVSEAVLGKRSPKEALDRAVEAANKQIAVNKQQYGY